ncbi:MAG TPA: aldo/keto reductase, partial [Vicinamibacteria bacterium]|nr:aldo/keto reductase [Vicinamibacteria bacterium]
MQTRVFGRTGVKVSEIGYGAWGIGKAMWIGADDAESMRALDRALDLGVDFIDTALGYGRGHSESLVGQVIRERGAEGKVFVATKVPPKNLVWPAQRGIPVSQCFPGGYVRSCAEKSLYNLGLERIDLLQLHTWQDEYLDQKDAGWADALLKLKDEGKVRSLGISINDHDPASALRAVASGLFDSVQVIYNIFDQSPEKELFPACRQHGVAVIARVPFDEGSLTGRITAETTFPDGDWRNHYFQGDRKRQVEERVRRLQPLLDGEAHTLPELALRFCLSHDAVSTVIPGMRTVKNVEANAAVSDGRRLSPT